METEFNLPVSITDIEESRAGWPFRKPKDDVDEPDWNMPYSGSMEDKGDGDHQ